MKDLGVRLASGVIGLALLIGIVRIGNQALNMSVLIISIVGLREFFLALKSKGYKPLTKLSYIYTILLFFLNSFGYESYLMLLITCYIMISLTCILMKEYNLNDVGLTILSVFYIPFLLNHVVYLDGTLYIWLVFIIAFGTDTFAYFAGNLFGKNKLCPEISPNKTKEGAVGGIIGSIILTFIFSKVIGLENQYILLPLAIISSVISQTGDLVASKIKRFVGIKDYGFIIPGHGGVMDRFDSIIFTAPVVYYYCKLFIL